MRSLPFLLSLLLLSGCGTSSGLKKQAPPRPVEATILAVNDMHATLDHLPRLAFVADSLRGIYPDLLLVSAGDNQTGNPANDNYEPKGFPMIDLMNDLGFAVSAVGNHEFDSDVKGFEFLSRKADFPFISANVHKPEGSRLKLKPYVILTLKTGTKVGFVSLLDVSKETGLPASHPDKMKGFTFLPPLEHALDYDAVADSADIVLFLNHLGFEADKELADRLNARRYPLIIGGHSHTLVPEGTVRNGIRITQAKSNLKYATLIRISKRAEGTYDIRTKNLPIDPKGSVDKNVTQKVQRYLDNPALLRVIGKLDAPLKNKEQIGYLFTDALRDVSGADFALANGGGVRIPSLPEGDIRVRDIYAADPFGNEGVVYDLTGRQIADLLLRHWKGDGYKICFPSGFKIRYVTDGPAAEDDSPRIELSDLQGKPLDPDKTYSVAMNNYLSTTFLSADLPYKSLFMPTAEITIGYVSRLKEIPSYDSRKLVEVTAVE